MKIANNYGVSNIYGASQEEVKQSEKSPDTIAQSTALKSESADPAREKKDASAKSIENKGTLLIDLSPEEIASAKKGKKATATEPEKAKEKSFSEKAKEVANFIGNAAQEALMQWAGKGVPIPLPPTPPDVDTGKNMHNGVTALKEMKNRNYEKHVDQKGGGNSE